MPSPKKSVWQNPKDVMKTHLIKRQSSTTKTDQAKSRSTTKSGMKSGSAVKPRAAEEENSQKSQIDSESLKRKNPFICETTTQTAFKRRSILDSQLSSSSFTGCEQRSLGNGDFPNDANIPKINKSPSLPSRLIGILTEAENMVRSYNPGFHIYIYYLKY